MKPYKVWMVAGAIGAVVVPTAVVAGPAAAAPRAAGSVAQVLPPLPGDTGAGASLMNDAGQVVGFSRNRDGSRPVRWEPDLTPTRLGLLEGGTQANPRTIVADGSIAGEAEAADSTWHPVTWGPTAAIRQLREPAGYVNGSAEDLNDDGVAVGTVSDNRVSRAVRWNREGQPELLPVEANMRYSQARFVDRQGNAYGWMGYDATDRITVRWDRSGNITRLDAPGSRLSELRDVNDRGTAAGTSVTGDTWLAALALPGRTFAPLPGAQHQSAVMDVNNADAALGYVNGTATRWEGGEMVRLRPLPDATTTQVRSLRDALNDAGTATGSSGKYAVTWDADGRPSKLPVAPDVQSSYGLVINGPGQVLGYVDTWSAYGVPVVWR
ncbi:hypothetical protein [Streptomyces sp. NPDC059063]|uniref:hypothetical protein n=1 Tax=unclassified Streptomyces TaxID=2593676 RepID=UPI0036C2C0E2